MHRNNTVIKIESFVIQSSKLTFGYTLHSHLSIFYLESVLFDFFCFLVDKIGK